MSVGEDILDRAGLPELDEVVRSFPAVLDGLRTSYEELEKRAVRVEDELCRTNSELEAKVRELDGLKRHLEAVLGSLPCGVVVRDADGAVVEGNAATLSLLGLSREELLEGGGDDALRGEEADGEPREVFTRDGRRLVLASSYSPVRHAGGEPFGSVEILEDHTERAEMTERLHATDKMAALGTMAAGIAHEIRNPLNAVKGFGSLLLRRPEQDEKTRRWCRLIVDAASEADTIIESMLSFGSPQRLRLEPIDPEELISHAVRLALPDGDGPCVEVTTDVSTSRFLGDRIKLRQAIRNLVANAVEAQQDRDTARVHTSITREGDDVVVRVQDAGVGVAPEVRPRIFDPFFTNEPEGTGLGLALVATIVRLHDGRVLVSPDPSPLGGAEFVLRIPHRPVPLPVDLPNLLES
jgi:signal transduction histidine kinase